MARHRPDLIEGSSDDAIYSIQNKVCDYQDERTVRVPLPEYYSCGEKGKPDIPDDIGNV